MAGLKGAQLPLERERWQFLGPD